MNDNKSQPTNLELVIMADVMVKHARDQQRNPGNQARERMYTATAVEHMLIEFRDEWVKQTTNGFKINEPIVAILKRLKLNGDVATAKSRIKHVFMFAIMEMEVGRVNAERTQPPKLTHPNEINICADCGLNALDIDVIGNCNERECLYKSRSVFNPKKP